MYLIRKYVDDILLLGANLPLGTGWMEEGIVEKSTFEAIIREFIDSLGVVGFG